MSKILIFPTDTVFGIGCSVFDKEGQARIYEIKRRPLNKQFPVLCANMEQIEQIAVVNSLAKKLIDKFFPGPLTIILKTNPEVRDLIGYDTIGVRIPKSELAQSILLENGPMATTSVNLSGEKPLNTFEEINSSYANLVDHIYGDHTEIISSNIASTVVDCTNNMLELIRVGEISLAELIKNV